MNNIKYKIDYINSFNYIPNNSLDYKIGYSFLYIFVAISIYLFSLQNFTIETYSLSYIIQGFIVLGIFVPIYKIFSSGFLTDIYRLKLNYLNKARRRDSLITELGGYYMGYSFYNGIINKLFDKRVVPSDQNIITEAEILIKESDIAKAKKKAKKKAKRKIPYRK